MYKHAVVGLVLLLLVGCSETVQSEKGEGPEKVVSAGHMLPHPSQALPSSQPHHLRRVASSFARMADRGNLIGYPAKPQVRYDGAYTWHRADISEAHALRAVIDGTMRITTPSGEALDFRYERHVEHPSGDWTWIGRVDKGASSDEAIVTFGDRATFGSIAQPGRAPLRLTIRNGVAWLVETDRSKIAMIDNAATRPTAPDYFVPPKLSALGNKAYSSSPLAEASVVTAAPAAAAATTTVDVLLGYTNGFASEWGGQSQAVTRLNHLVDIANQAYANSQLDARIRLVHAMQVTYPDATDNGDALEKLTGYRSGSGSIPVDPAFNALRAARDQYGADLVSLVRKFNTPENSSCGIAWLIGSGRSGINSSDAPFGYSVVGDGDDDGFGCRLESLAHELGHNMGSQHDRAAATENGVLKYGVYDYSFGYKTGAGSGNFYTVMAYGDSGQTTYRIFSNPRATTFCGGLACGVSGQADNALSLSQTMPIVGAFRATVVPIQSGYVLNDVDGDGRSDIVFQRPGALSYSIMAGAVISRSMFFLLSSSYYIATMGDYDGNGTLDIVWTSPANDLYVWMGDGNGFSAPISLGTYGAGWTLVTGGGDVNGDGKSDLVWQRPGMLAFSLMNGAAIERSSFFSLSSSYRVAATGDYDGNGRLDILWTSSANDLYVWLGAGEGFSVPQYTGVYGAGWTIWPNGGDVDGDGKSDILFHRPGALSYSIMNGASIARSSFFPLSSSYYVAATGDYDANGRQDVLWTSSANDMYIWFGNGSGYSPPQFVSSYGAGWAIVK